MTMSEQIDGAMDEYGPERTYVGRALNHVNLYNNNKIFMKKRSQRVESFEIKSTKKPRKKVDFEYGRNDSNMKHGNAERREDIKRTASSRNVQMAQREGFLYDAEGEEGGQHFTRYSAQRKSRQVGSDKNIGQCHVVTFDIGRVLPLEVTN